MSNSGSRSPNDPIVWFLCLLSAVCLPVGFALDGTSQWIFLALTAGAIYVSAYRINLNNRRTRQQ